MSKRFVLFAFLSLLLGSCFNGYNENRNAEDNPGYCGNASDPDNVRAQNAPSIFKQKCAACHYLNRRATGPALDRVLKRVPSEEWLRAYITNEDSLARIGDSATLAIQPWSPTSGNHNFKLTEKQLDDLIEYMK